ncbi:MAG: twin-arginine translocase TatA/TatE family subunit [Chloroflexota bacterium]
MATLAVFGLPGGGEWIIILLGIVLLFGAKKIPELMRGLGTGIKEFKKATTNESEHDKGKEIARTTDNKTE